MAQDTLKKVFDFDSKKVAANYKHTYPKNTFGIKNEGGAISATVSTFFPNEKGILPSEELFKFYLPQELMEQSVIEIGRLVNKNRGHGDHSATLELLKAIMDWSKQEGVQFWTATVRDEMLALLTKLNLPYHVSTETQLYEADFSPICYQHIGNFTSKPVYHIFCAMEESYKILAKH